MLLRNYLSSFSIIIILSPFIFLCLSSPALAQPIKISILIDEFRTMSEEINWLSKAGPGWLRSALYNAVSVKLVELTCFVKGETQTRDLPQTEPKGSMDESAFSKPKERRVDYVISVTCTELPRKLVRLDARVEKVEKAGAFISEGLTFSLNQMLKEEEEEEEEPFQPLADKLVNALYEHLNISQDKPYMVLLTGFTEVCPNEWKNHVVTEDVQNRIRELLDNHRIKQTELRAPIDIENTSGKSGNRLSEMYPDCNLFIIGKIIIKVQSDSTIMKIYLIIVDKKDIPFANSSIDFNPFSTAEIKDSLINLIKELKKDFEVRIQSSSPRKRPN